MYCSSVHQNLSGVVESCHRTSVFDRDVKPSSVVRRLVIKLEHYNLT